MTTEDIERASAVLARAFRDDPFMAYLMPDEPKRIETLPWFLATTVRYCLAYGEVHRTPEGDAIACWLTPDNTDVTNLRVLHTGGAAIPLKLGLQGYRRLRMWQACVYEEHARYVPEPHYYLYVLGVDPRRQGRGIGRTLLEPMLERADAESAPCYLETHSERNVRVYESIGFGVRSMRRVPKSGLSIWTLRREPQP